MKKYVILFFALQVLYSIAQISKKVELSPAYYINNVKVRDMGKIYLNPHSIKNIEVVNDDAISNKTNGKIFITLRNDSIMLETLGQITNRLLGLPSKN